MLVVEFAAFPLASSAASSAGWAFFLWLLQFDPLAKVCMWREKLTESYTRNIPFEPYHRMGRNKDADPSAG